MYVMQPVWQFFTRLDGFETVAIWIGAFTSILIAGFLIDYILQKQGFGVLINSVFVALGIALGFYVRFAYAKPSVIPLSDPLLTITVILGVTISLIIVLAALRNRFY